MAGLIGGEHERYLINFHLRKIRGVQDMVVPISGLLVILKFYPPMVCIQKRDIISNRVRLENK